MSTPNFTYVVPKQTTIEDISKIFFGDSGRVSEILAIEGNEDSIKGMFDDEELKANPTVDGSLVKPGTMLILPKQEAKRIPTDLAIVEAPTKSSELKKLFWGETAENYLKEYGVTAISFKDGIIEDEQIYVKHFSKVNVLLYSRALDEFVNLSPFITQTSISVGKSGGNWKIDLSPIEGVLRNGVKWEPQFEQYGDDIYSRSVSYREKERTSLYFKKIINSQDVIFFKFMEGSDLEDDMISTSLSPSSLKDLVMIGLVDRIEDSSNVQEDKAQTTISISGRDLSKVLQEDSTYFFPLEFIAKDGDEKGGQQQFIANYADLKEDGTVNRIFGRLNDLDWGVPHTIKELFDLIYEKLTYITLGLEESNVITGAPKGIWNFMSFKIEEEAGGRKLMDSAISTASGPVLQFFQRIVREPFVEMLFETFGSSYEIVVRTPPLTKEAYLNNFTIQVSEKFLMSEVNYKDDSQVHSFYRMIPDAIFLGNTDFSLVQFPAVFIEKFAKIYGARALQYNSNYLYFNRNESYEELQDTGVTVFQQAAQDLKFMIVAFIANQFFERGTKTFRNLFGLKRGINLYVPETDMLYYVDGYSYQIGQNEHTATVNLSRGVRLSDIDLYFDLVDVVIDENKIVSVKLDEEKFNKLLRNANV